MNKRYYRCRALLDMTLSHENGYKIVQYADWISFNEPANMFKYMKELGGYFEKDFLDLQIYDDEAK